MNMLNRIVNAIRKSPSAPAPGRVVMPRPEDSVRDYPSAGLTPARLTALLREADDGSLSGPMQLFEEMEEKDPHLYAVANTRRLALTGMRWDVVSAADAEQSADRASADAAAAYCREIVQRLDGFDEALQHLSLATGRNIAVAEIVWDAVDGRLRPVAVVPVDGARIVFDELDRPRVLTDAAPRDGIALAPGKFIVHAPHGVSGHPQRGGLLRVSAMVYLAKNLALKQWMIFAEVFGMPVRIARYDASATAEEKREMLTMLESLGTNAAGIFSKAIELQLVEANRGTSGPPYQALIDFLNRELSKAWLGQTLTTETAGQTGSFAAAKVHETVRADVLADDVRKEARTIRRDLLVPLTAYRFGPGVAAPLFRRRPESAPDVVALTQVLDAAVNRLGLNVPRAWAHEALGVPMGRVGEESIGRRTRRR
jgi:phage gp29-like protein